MAFTSRRSDCISMSWSAVAWAERVVKSELMRKGVGNVMKKGMEVNGFRF